MNKFLFIFLLISFAPFAQEQLPVRSYSNPEFEIGSTQFLFGDNVALREEPSTNSESIETLSIGTGLIIKAKAAETMSYKGYECNWYKVKCKNGATGYVMGGLIARAYSSINGVKYLVSVQKQADQRTTVEYRYAKKSGGYLSGKAELETYAFLIKTYDNRGLEGIESMLYLDYYAESCGVNGGGIYIFNDGEKLTEAIKIASLVDGGSFWFSEELTFPNDENGIKDVVKYKREHGEEMDEETSWMKIKTDQLNLMWINGAFSPNVSKIDFDKEI